MKKTLLFLALLPVCFWLQAQQVSPSVLNSTGGSATLSGGGYLAWSVGEPVIGTATASNATITQGFLQTWPDALKNLMLTLYLEGLYNGTGLNKAKNATGDQYSGNIADKITVELHNSGNYATIVYSDPNVNLSTAGQATLSIPGTNYGSYYVTVKHRNSIETTTAAPVSFSGSSISYAFDTPSKAYGSNLKQLAPSPLVYGIYAGNVNADGKIDDSDLSSIQTSASAFSTGYLTNDVNGDGIVDALDLIMTDNNAALFAIVKKP